MGVFLCKWWGIHPAPGKPSTNRLREEVILGLGCILIFAIKIRAMHGKTLQNTHQTKSSVKDKVTDQRSHFGILENPKGKSKGFPMNDINCHPWNRQVNLPERSDGTECDTFCWKNKSKSFLKFLRKREINRWKS